MAKLLINGEDVDLNSFAMRKPLGELSSTRVSSAARDLLQEIYGHAVRAVSIPILEDDGWVGTCEIDGQPLHWQVAE